MTRFTQSTVDGVAGISQAKGSWEAGKLHGYAYVQYENNSWYRGMCPSLTSFNLCEDLKVVFVLTEWLCRGVIGEWKNGLRSGHGYFQSHRGRRYLGSWENDLKHGYGQC
jgi:hypothetical protein